MTSRRFVATTLVGLISVTLGLAARASDHLDSPSTVANPQADIADVYAWTSSDARRLNLVMTVLGSTFSDKVEYVLHIDSGKAFGHSSASVSIACHFAAANAMTCKLGEVDSAVGDPTQSAGIEGRNGRFRVFAGPRDDPFYNNVKGLLGAYQAAINATRGGARVDSAGCAHFDTATAAAILYQMSHTDKGAPQNLLYNWSVSAIVVSVDLAAVTAGGKLVAVWGTTQSRGKRLDHMGRPFVANTLLGSAPFSTDEASGLRRQAFNEATAADASGFVADIEKSLAFQDSLDGKCGNQLIAGVAESPARYRALAEVFADDRLWVNTASGVCTQFFAVELVSLSDRKGLRNDCGGRSPTYDTSNVWRSLLIAGATVGVTDGLRQDEHPPSATEFPYLAPPDPHRVDH